MPHKSLEVTLRKYKVVLSFEKPHHVSSSASTLGELYREQLRVKTKPLTCSTLYSCGLSALIIYHKLTSRIITTHQQQLQAL